MSPSSPPRARETRRRKSRLALLVVAGLGVLGLGEVWVRMTRADLDLWQETGRSIGENPMKEWGLVDAFSAYTGRPGYGRAGKTINAHGFMSTPEISADKPPGTVRLLFLGGSSTAGTGVELPDAQTWPWQVRELLAERLGDKVQVDFINGALGGYSSFESYGRLWSRLRVFEPDVIVVYHGWNELYYFPRGDGENLLTWRRLSDGDWTLDRTNKPIRRLAPWWIDHVLRYSQLAIRIRFKIANTQRGEVGTETDELRSGFDPDGLAVFRTNLRLLAAAAEILGAELFVAKQATLIVPGLAAADRKRCRYDYHGMDHDTHVAAYAALYGVIDEVRPPDRVIDVTPLSGRSELFEDHVHPTPTGATAIARIVADAIEGVVRARGGE